MPITRYALCSFTRHSMDVFFLFQPFVCWLCAKPFFHASKLRMHLKEKHDTDVLIRKKDVLESGTEYEITFVNAEGERRKETLPITDIVPIQDEQTAQFYEPMPMLDTDELESRKLSLMDETCDEPVSSYQLLNELTVNDIETLVKNNPFVLSDNDLRTCSSGGHHQHFDDLKLIDFPVMWAERERKSENKSTLVSSLVFVCCSCCYCIY